MTDVVCTFTNTQQAGSITIQKTAVGGSGTFGFTSADSSLNGISLTANNGTVASSKISKPAGTYSITETQQSGWQLTGLTCSGGGSTFNTNQSSRTATVNLAAGDNVVCTFTNTQQQGSITIQKTAVGGSGTFGFTSANSSLNGISLTANNGTVASSKISKTAGTYSITETQQSGWQLTDLKCSSNGNRSTFNTNLSNRTASIGLAAGENVDCTFTNTQQAGSITIHKTAVGGSGTFGFTSADTDLKGVSLPANNGTAASAKFSKDGGPIYHHREPV